MKNKVIWLGLSLILVAAMLLASCAKSTTVSTSAATSTTSTTKTTSTTTLPETTTTLPTTIATTTTASGNWWDKLGKPQYGGNLTIRTNRDITLFDPAVNDSNNTVESAWMDRLFADDWTLNPTVFDYKMSFRPAPYVKGLLAESWQLTDPSTLVVNLRQGIHWQNILPTNGREFVASDIVAHFDRLFGLGGGFTQPTPYYTGSVLANNLVSVAATGKYTVVFKWKTSNPEIAMEELQSPVGANGDIEAPEVVQAYGNTNDWHHAVGTGPFLLQDFVPGSSATMVRNPNYWGHDERYPQNQLPYVDKLAVLIISDDSTALAGLRAGKIDALDQMTLQNAQSMKTTNPEILQTTSPRPDSVPTIDPRNDVVPFKDIRVREAMQMAINLPEIASGYYGGTTDPWPSSLTSNYLKGWNWPYPEWPQDLKDQYAYNPTQAKALLAAAGYPTIKTNIVADSSGDLILLQIVKSYFSAVGIDMEIRTLDASSWNAFVMTGKKHDQLAARSNGSLGIAYQPIRQFARFMSGYVTDWAMVNDPVQNDFYPKAMAATSVDQMQQILIDENKYVAQKHYVISLLQPNSFVFYQPWLKGYNGQNQAISYLTAHLIGFYDARFWIDRSLKTSLGH